jgi:hypothetical protein
MRILLLLVIVFVGSGPPRLAAAGAWLQPRGGSYLKASGLYSATEERIDCRGEVEPAEPFGGTYSERKIFLYGEFGLFDRMTLVGSFGFGEQKIVDASVPDYGTRSSGDLKIGTRWGLLRSPATPVSVETVLSVPTYPTTDVTLPVGQREQFLPAGTGEFEFEVRLQAGASFWPRPFYANVDGGIRARGGQFGNQWLLAGEVGAGLDRFFMKVEVRGIWPTGDTCSTGAAGAVSINERSLRIGPEAAFRVAGDWWLGATWTTLLSGRNTLDNDQLMLSVAWSRTGAGD